MSEHGRGYLRMPRRAAEIVLGLDGHAVRHQADPQPPAEPLDDPVAVARAQEIVADAEAQARAQSEAIIAQATHDATAIRDDAYRAGHDEGYGDGVREARGELADAMSLLQHTLQQSHAIHERMMRNTERDVIELVIDVARSVLGEQVAIEPTLVLDVVERAFARAGAQNVVRIRVHPEDHEVVSAAMTERHGEPTPFVVLGDHSVAVGGCVIDTGAGEIDARLDVQLDEIARLLRSSLPDPEIGAGVPR